MNATVMSARLSANAHPLRWSILATMVAAQFMFVVDAFIVNVAVPSIRTDLGASNGQASAVIAAYQIAYASLVITGGRLGDVHGAKRTFLLGLGGFIAASLWCGLAGSGNELIVARLAQGAAGALMVPQILGMIHSLFTEPAERARAFGVFGVALGLGGAAGFVLGGALVSLDLSGLGWRMIFFVNIPVGIAIAVAAGRLMPASRTLPIQVDAGGAALLFAGLVGAMGPVMFGRELGSVVAAIALTGAGILILAGFIVFERGRARAGKGTLVNLGLLRNAAFVCGAAAAFCFFAGNVSFYLATTLFLQNGLSYSPWQAGLAVLPLAILFTLASRLAAGRAVRRGVCALMDGCGIEIASLLVLAALIASEHTEPLLVVPVLAVFGAGQGLVMAPIMATVLANVDRSAASAGAGMLATVQQAGNAAGVAVVGTLYFSVSEEWGPRAAFLVSLAMVALAVASALAFLVALRATLRPEP